MNYSEMSHFEINEAVSKVLLHQEENPDAEFLAIGNYCSSWADAGPIIAANKISLDFDADGYEPPQNAWCKASSPCGQVYYGGEIEPLRAAMIVFLMMQDKK